MLGALPAIHLDGPVTAVAGALAAAALLVGVLEAFQPGSRGRRVARACVRVLLLATVAAAALRPSLTLETQAPRRLVAVLDPRALATPDGRAEAGRFLARVRALATRDGADTLGLLATEPPAPFDPAAPLPPADAVGPAGALRDALGAARLALGADATGLVVLGTDGRAPLDGVAAATRELAGAGIPVRGALVPPPPAAAPLATIDDLDVPDLVRGPLTVRAALRDVPEGAQVRLLLDGTERGAPRDPRRGAGARVRGIGPPARPARGGAAARAGRRGARGRPPPCDGRSSAWPRPRARSSSRTTPPSTFAGC